MTSSAAVPPKGFVLAMCFFASVARADQPRGRSVDDLVAHAAARAARGEDVFAIAEYRDVIHRFPRHAAAYVGLVALYDRLGDLDQALEVGRTGLAFVPGHVELSGAVAHALAELGEAREALATMRAACAAHPDDRTCPRLLASVAESAGATLEALTALRRMLDTRSVPVGAAGEEGDVATDDPARREAADRAEALALLAADVDPANGRCASDETPLARALARCAERPSEAAGAAATSGGVRAAGAAATNGVRSGTARSASPPPSPDRRADSRARAPGCSGTRPPGAR